jgi:hypothetical protein
MISQRDVKAEKKKTVPDGALAYLLPEELQSLADPQVDIPRIAKDKRLIRLIEEAAQQVPTRHTLIRGDARFMDILPAKSVHLVLQKI